MNLHFLASTLVRGGAETMALALSRGMAARGHQVRWTLLREPGELGETIPKTMNPVCDLAPTRTALARVDRLRARLVGDHGLYVLDHDNAVIMAAAAAPLAGVDRRVVGVHTTGRWGGRPSLGRAMKAALRSYHAVLALSPVHRDYLVQEEGMAPDSLRIVPNGIEPERFSRVSRAEARAGLDLSPDAPLIGSVAMLRPEKNHRLLLDAAARLAVDRPELQVVLVGEGQEREALEQRAQQPDLAGRVRFLGLRSDVEAVLPALDVFALTSHPRVETQPISVLEAMAAGVPVTATRVGDLAGLLQGGKDGLLVADGDEDGLVQAIGSLLDDNALHARYADRGRQRVLDFTLDASCDALGAVLLGSSA